MPHPLPVPRPRPVPRSAWLPLVRIKQNDLPVMTMIATSWGRIGRPILLHPDVVRSPLVERVAAAGLATKRVDNPQQTLLRPSISAFQNRGEHDQQLVSRQREGGQRAGLQLARQIAVVRPVAALQGKDDR